MLNGKVLKMRTVVDGIEKEKQVFTATDETVAAWLAALAERIDSLAAAHRAILRILRARLERLDESGPAPSSPEPGDGVDALCQSLVEACWRLDNEIVRANLICERVGALGIDQLPVYQERRGETAGGRPGYECEGSVKDG